MMSMFRQAWMSRPWRGVLLICICATGIFLFGPVTWHNQAAMILFGLVAMRQLGRARAAPRGSLDRHDWVALGGLLAAICGSYAISALVTAGVPVPWATPLRYVLMGTASACALLYLIARWLFLRQSPNRAEAR